MALLVIGSIDKGLIQRHKRTRSYTEADFDLLRDVLGNVDVVVVTPNILTETSNLIRQIDHPVSRRLSEWLAGWLTAEGLDERYLSSAAASQVEEYPRLGLTDAGILEAFSQELPVLTDDLDLYLAAAKRKPTAAQNFHHLRAI